MPQSAQQRRAIEGRGAAILPDTWGLEMNDAILAALFPNFAGATSLNSVLSGHRGRSTIANKLFRLAMIGGTSRYGLNASEERDEPCYDQPGQLPCRRVSPIRSQHPN